MMSTSDLTLIGVSLTLADVAANVVTRETGWIALVASAATTGLIGVGSVDERFFGEI